MGWMCADYLCSFVLSRVNLWVFVIPCVYPDQQEPRYTISAFNLFLKPFENPFLRMGAHGFRQLKTTSKG